MSLCECLQELASAHIPFARKLFRPAFSCYWAELVPNQQTVLMEALERVMQDNPMFMQLMLSVVEFMSHYQVAIRFPVSEARLGHMGLQCHAYAKALRYKEVRIARVSVLLWAKHRRCGVARRETSMFKRHDLLFREPFCS